MRWIVKRKECTRRRERESRTKMKGEKRNMTNDHSGSSPLDSTGASEYQTGWSPSATGGLIYICRKFYISIQYEKKYVEKWSSLQLLYNSIIFVMHFKMISPFYFPYGCGMPITQCPISLAGQAMSQSRKKKTRPIQPLDASLVRCSFAIRPKCTLLPTCCSTKGPHQRKWTAC